MKITANDPTRKSWVHYDNKTDFPIQNIPFGVMSSDNNISVCSRIGDYIVNLSQLFELGVFNDIKIKKSDLDNRYLNDFIALGKPITNAVRNRIAELLDSKDSLNLKKDSASFLISIENATMLLPIKIGDYTDFYSSREHATNVGIMFRDPENALMPNWLHLPVAYHGRASSIVVSGEDVIRPKGQILLPDGKTPTFGASKQLDFELEMAFIIGKASQMGTAIPTDKAEDYIFGVSLFNDWSARDIQRWEYVPLGPFLGKNFASTLSPWIVTLEALEPFRIDGPVQEPEVLAYLKTTGAKNFNINLEVSIAPENKTATCVCKSNFKYLYWNMAQQLAHHTVNGCNMNIGDVCASGTISGHTPDSFGSMLEIAWKGTKPVKLNDGDERVFILDGDTVSLNAYAEKDSVRIGFGECTAKILPAL